MFKRALESAVAAATRSRVQGTNAIALRALSSITGLHIPNRPIYYGNVTNRDEVGYNAPNHRNQQQQQQQHSQEKNPSAQQRESQGRQGQSNASPMSSSKSGSRSSASEDSHIREQDEQPISYLNRSGLSSMQSRESNEAGGSNNSRSQRMSQGFNQSGQNTGRENQASSTSMAYGNEEQAEEYSATGTASTARVQQDFGSERSSSQRQGSSGMSRTSQSQGPSVSRSSDSQGMQSQTQSQGQSQSRSQGQGQGQDQGQSRTQSQDQGQSRTQSQDQGQSRTQSQGQGQSRTQSQGQSRSQSQGQSRSQSQGQSRGQSFGQGQSQYHTDQGQNQPQGQGQSQQRGQGQSQQRDQGQSQHQVLGQGQQQGQGQSQRQDQGRSPSQSLGTSARSSTEFESKVKSGNHQYPTMTNLRNVNEEGSMDAHVNQRNMEPQSFEKHRSSSGSFSRQRDDAAMPHESSQTTSSTGSQQLGDRSSTSMGTNPQPRTAGTRQPFSGRASRGGSGIQNETNSSAWGSGDVAGGSSRMGQSGQHQRGSLGGSDQRSQSSFNTASNTRGSASTAGQTSSYFNYNPGYRPGGASTMSSSQSASFSSASSGSQSQNNQRASPMSAGSMTGGIRGNEPQHGPTRPASPNGMSHNERSEMDSGVMYGSSASSSSSSSSPMASSGGMEKEPPRRGNGGRQRDGIHTATEDDADIEMNPASGHHMKDVGVSITQQGLRSYQAIHQHAKEGQDHQGQSTTASSSSSSSSSSNQGRQQSQVGKENTRSMSSSSSSSTPWSTSSSKSMQGEDSGRQQSQRGSEESFSKMAKSAAQKVSSTADTMSDKASDFGSRMKSMATEAADSLEDRAEKLADNISDKADAVADKVERGAEKLANTASRGAQSVADRFDSSRSENRGQGSQSQRSLGSASSGSGTMEDTLRMAASTVAKGAEKVASSLDSMAPNSTVSKAAHGVALGAEHVAQAEKPTQALGNVASFAASTMKGTALGSMAADAVSRMTGSQQDSHSKGSSLGSMAAEAVSRMAGSQQDSQSKGSSLGSMAADAVSRMAGSQQGSQSKSSLGSMAADAVSSMASSQQGSQSKSSSLGSMAADAAGRVAKEAGNANLGQVASTVASGAKDAAQNVAKVVNEGIEQVARATNASERTADMAKRAVSGVASTAGSAVEGAARMAAKSLGAKVDEVAGQSRQGQSQSQSRSHSRSMHADEEPQGNRYSGQYPASREGRWGDNFTVRAEEVNTRNPGESAVRSEADAHMPSNYRPYNPQRTSTSDNAQQQDGLGELASSLKAGLAAAASAVTRAAHKVANSLGSHDEASTTSQGRGAQTQSRSQQHEATSMGSGSARPTMQDSSAHGQSQQTSKTSSSASSSSSQFGSSSHGNQQASPSSPASSGKPVKGSEHGIFSDYEIPLNVVLRPRTGYNTVVADDKTYRFVAHDMDKHAQDGLPTFATQSNQSSSASEPASSTTQHEDARPMQPTMTSKSTSQEDSHRRSDAAASPAASLTNPTDESRLSELSSASVGGGRGMSRLAPGETQGTYSQPHQTASQTHPSARTGTRATAKKGPFGVSKNIIDDPRSHTSIATPSYTGVAVTTSHSSVKYAGTREGPGMQGSKTTKSNSAGHRAWPPETLVPPMAASTTLKSTENESEVAAAAHRYPNVPSGDQDLAAKRAVKSASTGLQTPLVALVNSITGETPKMVDAATDLPTATIPSGKEPLFSSIAPSKERYYHNRTTGATYRIIDEGPMEQSAAPAATTTSFSSFGSSASQTPSTESSAATLASAPANSAKSASTSTAISTGASINNPSPTATSGTQSNHEAGKSAPPAAAGGGVYRPPGIDSEWYAVGRGFQTAFNGLGLCVTEAVQPVGLLSTLIANSQNNQTRTPTGTPGMMSPGPTHTSTRGYTTSSTSGYGSMSHPLRQKYQPILQDDGEQENLSETTSSYDDHYSAANIRARAAAAILGNNNEDTEGFGPDTAPTSAGRPVQDDALVDDEAKLESHGRGKPIIHHNYNSATQPRLPKQGYNTVFWTGVQNGVKREQDDSKDKKDNDDNGAAAIPPEFQAVS